MDRETVTGIIEDVKTEICDDYCKYAAEACGEKECEDLMRMHYEKCPLNRL